MTNILIIVDVQNDFLPGGALGVKDGFAIIEPITELASEMDLVIATRDWHPKNHSSFRQFGGQWPPHCIKGTKGAKLLDEIDALADVIISKGQDVDKDAYSAFSSPQMHYIMRHNRTFLPPDLIYVVGLATDYCVAATAIDALNYNYSDKVIVPLNCTRGVSPTTTKDAILDMEKEGIQLPEGVTL